MYDFSFVLHTTLTKVDALLIDQAVDHLEQTLYTTHADSLAGEITKLLGVTISEAILESAGQNEVSIDNSVHLSEFLRALQTYVTTLPVIELTLAVDPTRTLIESLVSWSRENVSPTAIINVTVTPTVLGGAIIVYNGKYKDFSVSRTLETFFATKQETFIKQV